MRNAWGLEGFAQQSLAHGSGVTIHLVGVGGQTLFAAGLPTFRGDAELIQFL